MAGSLMGGDMALQVFQWPPRDGEEAYAVQCFVIMTRPGGMLLAFPGAAVTDELVDRFAEPETPASEPLIGAYTRMIVPLFFSHLEPTGSTEILVADLSEPPASSLFEPFVEENPDFILASRFLEEGDVARINLEVLMDLVRDFLAAELGDRMAFYSAQEEEADRPQATPKAATTAAKRKAATPNRPPGTITPGREPDGQKPPAKKQTVASLAGQLEVLMQTIPALTKQVEAIAARQETMENPPKELLPAQPEVPFRTPTAGRTAMPVSSLLQGSSPNLGQLAHMVGAPPKTRQAKEPQAATAAIRKFPEDEHISST